MSQEQRNKQLVRDFIDALNRGDVAAIADAYTDDGYCLTMGNTLISGKFGKAQVRQAAGLIYQAFPQGIHFTIDAMTAEGERVALEAHSEGLHASGRTYTNQYHFLFEFRDGQLAVLKEYMDTERVTEILCGGQRRPAGA
ncbi:MAG: nuclear transport factor 2 family protein [Nevskia sp.]|nr:nuclear transport factor 2 family protein [Nevskia sp.]